MDSIVLKSGGVRLCINDDPNRVIAFNPNDIGFVTRFFGLIDLCRDAEQDAKEQEPALRRKYADDPLECARALIALEAALYDKVSTQIDAVFGAGTAQTAFGDEQDVDLVVQLLEGVRPYVAKARQTQIDKYTRQTAAGVLE